MISAFTHDTLRKLWALLSTHPVKLSEPDANFPGNIRKNLMD